jgi:hypothetical protein
LHEDAIIVFKRITGLEEWLNEVKHTKQVLSEIILEG